MTGEMFLADKALSTAVKGADMSIRGGLLHYTVEIGRVTRLSLSLREISSRLGRARHDVNQRRMNAEEVLISSMKLSSKADVNREREQDERP